MLILAIFWPALAGVLIFLLPAARSSRSLRAKLCCGALALEFVPVLALCGARGLEVTLLQMTPTLSIFLKVDTVGCVFAVLMCAMWLLAAVFALEYLEHDAHEASFQAFYMTVLSALVGQCFAGSMVTLYVFYELMTLLSVPLVVHERTPQAVAAGVKYLVYSIFGAMLGLMGIFFFNHYLGTVTFAPGGVAPLSGVVTPGLLVVTFLVILGFGTKAGMFPMHGWLPTAHPVAPAPASAVLSGVITKAGVLAIVRVVYFLVGAKALAGTWVQTAFMTLALITVFMGSMLAYREPLLKKRLAYSTVSQVSYVLFGLSCMVPEAFEGALLHVLAHSTIKDALFLCAGAIIHQTGKTMVSDLRGIGKQMPVTIWCWTIASLGLIGIPPTGGFVSKWQLATGSLASGMGALSVIGPVVLIISALLTAAYLLPVTIYGFFPGSDFDYASLEKKEPGWLMLVPMLLLAAGVVLTGVLAQPLISAFASVASAVL
ncbi:MAG: proton-conducting transporter membrane subunit [Clostridiales bacterium]|nr:proton-conducting transporter membrane subunit [Clostridiales bacterium]MDY5348052.1 proton-conducting transporter membrane subunit [Candidatus Ventricola sp.]MDY5514144.1 proton-conducting transporter membrane subunit [Candidatus Ventricola sp.]